MTQQSDCSGVIIRRVSSADIQAILHLAEGPPTSPRWQRAAYDAFIRDRQPEDAVAKVLFVACARTDPPERIIGFAAFSAVAAGGGECELENMVVANEWRRRGIGRRLLHAGMLWCRTWGSAARAHAIDFQMRTDDLPDTVLWLEVRVSNSDAVAFYEKAGFTRAGVRSKYYAQPVEDALLMKRTLGSASWLTFYSPAAAC